MKSKRLKAGRKGTWKWERSDGRHRENGDNGCVCVVFVAVAFWRTERPCVCVCVFASPSTQFAGLIRFLLASETKSHPNPSIIYNTGRGRGRGRDII